MGRISEKKIGQKTTTYRRSPEEILLCELFPQNRHVRRSCWRVSEIRMLHYDSVLIYTTYLQRREQDTQVYAQQLVG